MNIQNFNYEQSTSALNQSVRFKNVIFGFFRYLMMPKYTGLQQLLGPACHVKGPMRKARQALQLSIISRPVAAMLKAFLNRFLNSSLEIHLK